MNDIFTTPKQFEDWLTVQSNSGGQIKEPITFKFNSHDDFEQSYRLLGKAVSLKQSVIDNTVKHEFAHADMCKKLSVYYHFRIDLEPPTQDRQMRIIPMVTHRIPNSVPEYEYASKSLLIALASEDPSEDDLKLAAEYKQIMEKYQKQ